MSLFSFRFWEYNSKRKLVLSGPISDYGLPPRLANMDAVFIWEGNGVTYFFKGSQYWRYNEQFRRAYTSRYPRSIRREWKFYGYLKAAVQWVNGRNYVFWRKDYLKLQKGKINRERGYPQVIADRWMKCKAKGRDLVPQEP